MMDLSCVAGVFQATYRAYTHLISTQSNGRATSRSELIFADLLINFVNACKITACIEMGKAPQNIAKYGTRYLPLVLPSLYCLLTAYCVVKYKSSFVAIANAAYLNEKLL